MEPTLNKPAAEAVERIANGIMAVGMETMLLMRDSGGWKHLGHATFEDWARAQPKYQLDRADRKVLIQELAETTNMTQREIAAVVGTHQSRVSQTLNPPDANASETTPSRAQEGGSSDANASITPPPMTVVPRDIALPQRLRDKVALRSGSTVGAKRLAQEAYATVHQYRPSDADAKRLVAAIDALVLPFIRKGVGPSEQDA